MKGCEERRVMTMFIRMGGGALGHHERLKEVGKEGGWSIVKKQAFQEVV
jgi:hypothetical protein